jgi:NAD(P)-dependent dehydrogenase (short-subunit alcohol dehydrogenase family)
MAALPHILVTGSSRGIGRAIQQALVARGARVIGHARHAGEDLLAADFSDPAGADRLWDAAFARLDGRVDVLINNAGIYEAARPKDDLKVWQGAWAHTFQVNLQASADLCRRAVLHWQASGRRGRIVNIASRAGYRGDSPLHWHYAASKAGMVAMTKTIARGYAGEGILAFAVCPGFTMTGMAEDYLASRGGDGLLADIPLGRVAEPEEVASIAAYLALDAPASMTGAVIDVNGASFVR